jgi:hypothetical protein
MRTSEDKLQCTTSRFGNNICGNSAVWMKDVHTNNVSVVTVTLKTTKPVCYARFGCLSYSDKAVQGHTAHSTGGAELTAQLRCWTEVECTRVGLRYRAERKLHVSNDRV